MKSEAANETKHRLSISVTIAAPPSRIWPIMSDVERWPLWTRSVKKSRRLDKGPFKVGSRALVFQPRLPPAVWRVTAMEEGRSFTWVSSSPGVSVKGDHRVEPDPGGSKVTLSVQFGGFMAGFAFMLAATITRRYLELEADGLKRQSEENSSPRRFDSAEPGGQLFSP